MDIASVLLIFLMIVILAIFCVCMLIVLIKKLPSVFKLKTGKYYFFVLFYIVTKLVICGILIFKIMIDISNNFANVDAGDIEKYFKNTLILADCSLIQLFLIVFQYYLTMCLEIIKSKDFFQKIRNIFSVVELIYLICALILLLLFDLNVIDFEFVTLFGLAINLLSISFFLVSFFYMNFLMTGILLPTATNEKIKRIYKVWLVILLSRFLMAAFEIVIIIQIQDGSFEGFIILIQGQKGEYLTQIIIFIIYLVLTLLIEGLPMMYSIKRSVVNALGEYLKTYDPKLRHLRERLIQNNEEINEEDYLSFYSQELGFDDFEEMQSLPLYSEVWQYSKSKNQDHEYIIKKSKQKISTYLREDVEKQLCNLRNKGIVQLISSRHFLYNSEFYLYQPYFEATLDSLVPSLNQGQKIRQALNIAKAISKLHQNNLAHGCLSPNNIFIQKDKVYISGLGLQSLKKYHSLISHYTNKSIFTAVEHLRQKGRVVYKPQKKSDIYSFGMILYELITENKDYRSQTVQQLEQKLCGQKYRPKMPTNIHPKIEQLIRKCWSDKPKQRPQIEEVIVACSSLL